MIHRACAAPLSRRKLLSAAAAAGVATAFSAFPSPVVAQRPAPHPLPSLPYPENALEPVISARTIGFHYGRHHRGYLDNLNRMVEGNPPFSPFFRSPMNVHA